MRRRITVVSVAGLVAVAACGDKIAEPRDNVASLVAAAPRPDVAEVALAAPAADSAVSVRTSSGGRKIIRNTTLALQVKDADAAIPLIDSIARRHGVIVGDAQIARRENKRQSAHYVLHVPAPEFDATLDALRALGEVQRENGAAEDVSKAYTDLETRIAVKESTVRRLQDLLATHTAKLSEVLEVEREIGRSVTELEQMKGERRYYDTQVATATITVEISEPFMVGPTRITPPVSVALHHSLELLGDSAATVAYFLAFIAPWAVLGSLLIWGLHRLGARWPSAVRRHILPS
jgi:hypothetical protein